MMNWLDLRVFLRAVFFGLAAIGMLSVTVAGDKNKISHQAPEAKDTANHQDKVKRSIIKINGNAYRIHGPYSHENLAVYVISSEQQDDQQFITLDEGLRNKSVIISEKDSAEVEELVIENKSFYPLYLQEGDRITGGKQDRTIQSPLVIKPRSGKMALPTFCIEQSRWSIGESGTTLFSAGSSEAVAPRSVRLAAKVKGSQREVWSKVRSKKVEYNSALQLSLGGSSLNVAIDSKGAEKVAEEYVVPLKTVVEKTDDAVGVVFAIDGKVEEVNIYPGKRLAARTYPRLLKSFAIDAAAASRAANKEAKSSRGPEMNWKAIELRNQAAQVRLNRRRNVVFASKTIGEALRDLQAVSGVPIHADWKALEPLGIRSSTAVSLEKSYSNVDAALKAALESAAGRRNADSLSIAFVNGSVHVSTPAGAREVALNQAKLAQETREKKDAVKVKKPAPLAPSLAEVATFIQGEKKSPRVQRINDDNTLRIASMGDRHYCESHYKKLCVNKQWIRDDGDSEAQLGSSNQRTGDRIRSRSR